MKFNKGDILINKHFSHIKIKIIRLEKHNFKKNISYFYITKDVNSNLEEVHPVLDTKDWNKVSNFLWYWWRLLWYHSKMMYWIKENL